MTPHWKLSRQLYGVKYFVIVSAIPFKKVFGALHWLTPDNAVTGHVDFKFPITTYQS